jgi:hypothetical protein
MSCCATRPSVAEHRRQPPPPTRASRAGGVGWLARGRASERAPAADPPSTVRPAMKARCERQQPAASRSCASLFAFCPGFGRSFDRPFGRRFDRPFGCPFSGPFDRAFGGAFGGPFDGPFSGPFDGPFRRRFGRSFRFCFDGAFFRGAYSAARAAAFRRARFCFYGHVRSSNGRGYDERLDGPAPRVAH